MFLFFNDREEDFGYMMEGYKNGTITEERNGDPFAKKNFLTVANAFYLATKGGGSFFGKVGSFEPDYEFDAVVLDDATLADFVERPVQDRFQRILWLHTADTVTAKFIQGTCVYQA